jgi:carboxylesterase type B
MCPQLKSRPENVHGSFPAGTGPRGRDEEMCGVLSVYRPEASAAADSSPPLPVMVFVYGGVFCSGGGQIPPFTMAPASRATAMSSSSASAIA